MLPSPWNSKFWNNRIKGACSVPQHQASITYLEGYKEYAQNLCSLGEIYDKKNLRNKNKKRMWLPLLL